MDPIYRWRNCCCQVRTSMAVAAAMMMSLAILNFALIFISDFYIGIFIFLLYSAAGIFALVATIRLKSSLLIATILNISSVLVLNAIWCVYEMIEYRTSVVENKGDSVNISRNTIISLLGSLLCKGLDVWFLVVSVKFRLFLKAKQAGIMSTDTGGVRCIPLQIIIQPPTISNAPEAPPEYSIV